MVQGLLYKADAPVRVFNGRDGEWESHRAMWLRGALKGQNAVYFCNQNLRTPVGWLRAISDDVHLFICSGIKLTRKTPTVQVMFHVKQLIN